MEDTEEAPHVYSLLCELAATGHPALQTPDAPQRVIATLAEAFLRDAVPTENPVYAQMVTLLRQIQVLHAFTWLTTEKFDSSFVNLVLYFFTDQHGVVQIVPHAAE